jgi:hypothetical protein
LQDVFLESLGNTNYMNFMTYDISVSESGAYIVVKMEGRIENQTSIRITTEAQEMGRQLGINRFLIDLTNSTNTGTPMDNYNYAYNDLKHAPGFDKTSIAAMVVAKEDHSHDFVETVLINTGVIIKLFREKNEAIDYLKKG